MAKTKYEMVREMFFDATNGIRKAENFPDGMYLMEFLSKKHCLYTITKMYNDWLKGWCNSSYAIERLIKELKWYNMCSNKTYENIMHIFTNMAR